MYLDLLTFKDNLLHASHSTIFSSSRLACAMRSFTLFPEQTRLVSSAKSEVVKKFETLAISLIYNKNNNGPKMDPCGTPHLI